MKIADIYEAKRRLEKSVHRTTLEYSETFSAMAGADIFMKLENLQKTGSFKVRGAYNAIAKRRESAGFTEVYTASAGNHAQGVAFAARDMEIGATIVMPKAAPIAKIVATENYGAKVELQGDGYDEAYAWAVEQAKNTGAEFIHPFDDEDVIAGQGTVALEVLEQNSNIDTIVVPAGGGGLLAGVAFAVKSVNPGIRVIGVQADRADAIVRSFRAKSYVALESIFTIADGIAVKKPGKTTLAYINEYVDDMVTVTDDEIAAAIILLMERTKLVVESAGAASLAACLHKKAGLGKRSACILSGGNIDVGFISKIIERGLVSRGRLLTISVTLLDKPGTLETFASIMAANNANIVSVHYDRTSAELHLNETILHVGCEVGGFEHGRRVVSELKKNGYALA